MPDFDPIDLGTYMPHQMLPIREAADTILLAMVRAHYVYTDSLMQLEHISDEDREELAHSLRDIPKLRSSYQLQEWSWSELREHLVTEEVQAFAVDENRVAHPLNRAFWVSEYGNVALSTGVVQQIPLYGPHGDVLMYRSSIDKLYNSYFESIKNNLEPPVHKFTSIAIGMLDHASEIDAEDYVTSRGAKAKYDIEFFLHEAFSIIYDANPMPRTQEELARLAIDAYQERGGKNGRPSRSWARAAIAKLWHRLEIGDK